MKERPILFQGAMVRALLAGTKTQTRRVCKLEVRAGMPEPEWQSLLKLCPYGQPGDRLWVRESFSPYEHREGCWYWADGRIAAHDCTKPKPSIHMHRWFSRITLEVTGVRAERLQNISDADALAEGVDRTNTSIPGYARQRYEKLWESINGADSWAANPWVWVVEFKRLESA